MKPNPPSRLAVVLSHPTQYYSPWFRWLRSHTTLEFRVFYLWEFGIAPARDPQFETTFQWDVDLLSGYENEFVPNRARDPGTHHFAGLRNPQVLARLAAWKPNAVLIFGYNWMSHLRVIAWARIHGIPLIFRGDSHFLERSPGWRRRWPLRWLYRQFAAITYVGAANRAYFERLGVPSRRLFFAPHAVDRQLFDPAQVLHHDAAKALRTRLGLADTTQVVLFAGKFVRAKQPRELLQAFLELARPRTAIIFVGDGSERPALEEMASRAPPGSVHFLPFANQTEMPARYLLADLFVLPSRGGYETWGLAVNEAMEMGRPCLVSDRVGSQLDLVLPGETGWVFGSADPADLKAKLSSALTLLEDSSATAHLHQRIAERIAGYGYQEASDGLHAALASLG